MSIYLALIRFHFWRFLTYPFELFSTFLRQLLNIAFLALFWSLIVGGSPQGDSVVGLLSYFLIARGVSDLVMAEKTSFGKLLRSTIKHGDLSSWMLRPLKLVPTLYAMTVGKNGMNSILAVVSIVIGLMLNPPIDVLGFISFLYFFLCSFGIAFAFNLLEGVLAFHFTEAQGMKNAINHVVKIFSGVLVPLNYFPDGIRSIIELLPFPYMVFHATQAFETTIITASVLQNALMALMWVIIMNACVLILWRRSLKNYEAIGL